MIDLLKEVSKDEYKSYDYVSHFIENKPSISTHWGIFGEFVSIEALIKIQKLNTDALYKEHVTNYIYSHQEHFSIKKIEVSETIKSTKNIRLTVDTENDFIEMKKLYKNYFDRFDKLLIEHITQPNQRSCNMDTAVQRAKWPEEIAIKPRTASHTSQNETKLGQNMGQDTRQERCKRRSRSFAHGSDHKALSI